MMTEHDWRQFLDEWRRDLPLVLDAPHLLPPTNGCIKPQPRRTAAAFERSVAAYLTNNPGEHTAAQLASALGMSPSWTRNALNHLKSDGRARIARPTQKLGRGRSLGALWTAREQGTP